MKQAKTEVEFEAVSRRPLHERCGICRHYDAPFSCEQVKGPVSGVSWCQLWERDVPR